MDWNCFAMDAEQLIVGSVYNSIGFYRMLRQQLTRLIIALLLGCLAIPTAVRATQEQDGQRTVEQLVESGAITSPQAVAIRTMLATTPSDRARFFVPSSDKSNGPASIIRRKAPELFRKQAEAEFAKAESLMQAGDAAGAYAALFRTVGFDPKHPKASRILEDPLTRMQKRKLTARVEQPNDLIGWPSGSYATIQTPHFLIASQAPSKVAGEVADICEQAFCLWQQCFFGYWSSPERLQARWNGQDQPLANTPRFQLVLFKNRDEYVRALKSAETNIEVSTGYYNPSLHCSFFYWGDPRSATTLRHELVHQFFQEFARTNVALDADQQTDIWVVEGIAMYIESATNLGGVGCDVFEVGGWDSPRLQAARYRRMHDEFWIPWEELRSEIGQRLRKRSDIKFFYSQAAGLTHLWMDSSPETRQALLDYIDSVYAGQPDESLLPDVSDDDRLRSKYESFLTVEAEQVRLREPRILRREVVLSRMKVKSADFSDWTPDARNLDWLDLSFTQVDDTLFEDETKPWNVRRLNVEGTEVTDEALARIAKIPSLVELDLSGCKVTSKGIKSLASHPKLATLWLTATEVDDSIQPTLQSLRSLEYVNLDETNVTKEGWKKMQTAMPKLRDN
jgi:hypothetical protein